MPVPVVRCHLLIFQQEDDSPESQVFSEQTDGVMITIVMGTPKGLMCQVCELIQLFMINNPIIYPTKYIFNQNRLFQTSEHIFSVSPQLGHAYQLKADITNMKKDLNPHIMFNQIYCCLQSLFNKWNQKVLHNHKELHVGLAAPLNKEVGAGSLQFCPSAHQHEFIFES